MDRNKEYNASVCLFIKNFAVRFDNNQAERNLRMSKANIKIGGYFRTLECAQKYLDIMSYASTARKLGYNAYMAIHNAISGGPMFFHRAIEQLQKSFPNLIYEPFYVPLEHI